jgi:hypothetical protein
MGVPGEREAREVMRVSKIEVYCTHIYKCRHEPHYLFKKKTKILMETL